MKTEQVQPRLRGLTRMPFTVQVWHQSGPGVYWRIVDGIREPVTAAGTGGDTWYALRSALSQRRHR